MIPGRAGAGADRAQRLLREGGGELVFGATGVDPPESKSIVLMPLQLGQANS